MATVKEAKRKSLIQILTLMVAVCIIVVVVVLAQKWFNSRPGTPPAQLSVTATAGGKSIEVLPYMVCELDAQCPEGTVPNLTVDAGGTLEIDVPEELASHQWRILTIYTDPAANDETLHGAGETTHVEIPGSVDPIKASTGTQPKLQLVEISALLIGHDDNGEETPVNTVWSLSTMTEDELAQSKAQGN
ncbi:hypothetical protein CPHO_09220 [Corynebacterium phocae]|uniref:DUF2771 domain-containing protein n=1 Tax=Corynebacterium phocae TaxID=161895 RepID=A0A1L7D4W3_9CORY|nr:DUF2771 domain-containing protein [Corynebacterium phocae]APT93033.1 hypothetical protein CPHO_09220 [Corynebacterium phocae]KAA8722524.1 DUF2771 domain-containing protein [Corynebacterium phocae]